MSYDVSYKIINKDDSIEFSQGVGGACFAQLMNRQQPNTVTKVMFHHNRNKMPYSEKEVERWVDLLNTWGFNVDYYGIDSKLYGSYKDDHVFIIDLTKGDNARRAWCISTLNLLRYLTEYSLNIIPRKCMQVCKENDFTNPEDVFQVMQFVHQYVNGGNINHALRGTSSEKCLTLDEFKKRANAIKKTIYNSTTFNLHELWKGDYIGARFNLEAATNLKKKKKEKKKKMNVHIVGGDLSYGNFLPFEYKLVKTLKAAQLVIFTGGEDVHPSFYGEKRGFATSTNIERDNYEAPIFRKAVELGIPIIGVCRGSQLTCALSGGKLVQHQENKHYVHPIQTTKYGTFDISSTHHQAQYPFNLKPWQYKIIGWTDNLSKMHLGGDDKEMNPPKEVEICYYPETNALAIQGHPEYGWYQQQHPEGLAKVHEIVNDFLAKKL